MRLPSFPFVVLDVEATGITPRRDRIIELALLCYEGGKEVAQFSSLFCVDRELPPLVRLLTHLSPSDLQGKPLFKEVLPQIREFLGGKVLVGHNILFDLEMLAAEGLSTEDAPWIDTAMLASLTFPELESWSLLAVSAALKLPHEPQHRALGDVRATTALLGAVWERLLELPEDLVEKLSLFSSRGPRGYATFFASLRGRGAVRPLWLAAPPRSRRLLLRRADISSLSPLIAPQAMGELLKELLRDPPKLCLLHIPPDPLLLLFCLPSLVTSPRRVWVAVPHLTLTLALLPASLPDEVTVLFPSSSLLNHDAWQVFQQQERFTADELTLAFKILLFGATNEQELPLHAEERNVWKGKLSCPRVSARYREQFQSMGRVILLDHRHLLELLAEGEGPAEGDTVLIDDATLLEDAATKAFRWFCAVDSLRAAAEGEEDLTRFLDAYQLWVEKVRSFQDIRYLIERDLQTPSARGLRERLTTLLSHTPHHLVREYLHHLQAILNPKNLPGRIAWIEQFRDRGQLLQSVPLDLQPLFLEKLYSRCSVMLLLPPGLPGSFSRILPSNREFIEREQPACRPGLVLRCADPAISLSQHLRELRGKAVVLVPSRRAIEQLAIEQASFFEEQGITLVAQGLSGGQGRMQAEFTTAPSPALWFVTPWTYEGASLPPGTADHLWIQALPFDHPSHAVLSRRAKLYRDPFSEYFLPRMLHRLFRILRTYEMHRSSRGDVLLLDARVHTREYGAVVRTYLEKITQRVEHHSVPLSP